MSQRRDGGFTLLEVLVAMVILSVAVVTLIQLASQGLRLLRVSGEHQDAVMLADRLACTQTVTVQTTPQKPKPPHKPPDHHHKHGDHKGEER